MNIQQYITPEMLLSLVVVGTMTLVYFCFRLTGRLHNRSNITQNEKSDSFLRVNAGQVWYKRRDSSQPFIDKEAEPIKILEFRSDPYHDHDWVRFEQDGQEHILSTWRLVQEYMQDEFNDMVRSSRVEKQSELELEIEFEEPAMPSRNIVSIEGKDFVLTPVTS
jgi:hypothetical protein